MKAFIISTIAIALLFFSESYANENCRWKILDDPNTHQLSAKQQLALIACEGKVDQLAAALKKTPVDTPSRFGATPLMLAANEGKLEMVEALLKAGAQVHLKDSGGKSVLSYASSSKNLAVVKKVYNANKNLVDDKDKLGNFPLSYAAMMGSIEIVNFLLDQGSPTDIKNGENSSPLYLTIRSGIHHGNAYIIAKKLISKGAEVNLQSGYDQFSPLMHAAEDGDLRAVKLLIDNNADRNLKNRNGKTAFDLATELGRDDIVKYLSQE